MAILTRPVRTRCPFCHGNPRCNTCGGTGWVTSTEYYDDGNG